MMGKILPLIAGVLMVMAAAAHGAAQESGPTTSPNLVQVAQGCDVPEDSVGAFCTRATAVNDNGSFASGQIYMQVADEWVPMTRCDDLVILCDTVTVRAEGVIQGDALPLVIGE